MMKWLSLFMTLTLPIFAHPSEQKIKYKCSTLSRIIEIEEELPPLLLAAVAAIESSDMPWVIGVAGVSHRYNTHRETLNKINELKASGIKNFDIGCMQISHFFHKHNFTSEEEMINPSSNIRYAAKLLKQLKSETGSWEKAVAYYNSRNLKLSIPYKQKVYQQWNKTRLIHALPLEALSFAHTLQNKPNIKLNRTHPESLNVFYVRNKKILVRR